MGEQQRAAGVVRAAVGAGCPAVGFVVLPFMCWQLYITLHRNIQMSSYEYTRKTVTTKMDLSSVTTPQHLLDQLLRTEVGNCDCADQPGHDQGNSEQRQLLLKLIEEYKAQIESKNSEIADAERLLEMRANLQLELERLKNERARIEQNIAAETQVLEQEHRVKMAGIGEADCGYVAEEAQLLHLRDANDKLRMRLKDLLDYIARMEAYNNQLSHNHVILTERAKRQIPTRDRDYEVERVIQRENLMRRMEQRAQDQTEQSRRAEEQMRRCQAEAMASVRAQEEEIHRRNVARLGTFRANYGVGMEAPMPAASSFYEGTFPGGVRGEERGYYRQGVFFPDNGLYQGHP